MSSKDFILASASPHRLALLEQIGFKPKNVMPADIDESIKKFETPTVYVKRMALEKALKIADSHPQENVLSCDTTIVVGGKVLHKAVNAAEQTKVMNLLSGRANKVLTAVCLIDKKGQVKLHCVVSRVITKRLSEEEIKEYVASNDWMGCCGYKIDGAFAGFVRKISGSYSGIVGLPLFETKNLLNGVGVK